MPEDFQARVRTPFATVGIAANARHVTAIRYLAPTVTALAPPKNTIAFLACVQLQAYLEDPKQPFDLPLLTTGSRHQLSVWEAMCRIAPGKTRTYGELARELKSSPRAVGGACGANRLPIVVPCHRVVAASGLGGFMGAAGSAKAAEGFELSIKRWLLEHEGALRG